MMLRRPRDKVKGCYEDEETKYNDATWTKRQSIMMLGRRKDKV